MSFNFKGVDAAKAGSYLKPGYYRARVSEVEAGEFEKSGIPYVAVTFTTKEGLSLTEKFTLKTKDPKSKFNPLSRLVYLHEAWLGEGIEAEFKSPEQIASFFKKALANKNAGVKTIIVGGEINGKVTYGRLPLTDFIVGEDSEVDLGEFEEGSEEWKQYVKKSTRTTEASGKKSGLLNSDDEDDFGSDDDDDNNNEEDQDEEVATKKTTKTSEKKTSAKTSEKKTSKKTDEEEGDGGWKW